MANPCPVCGDEIGAIFKKGESAFTPWRIDGQWKICVWDGIVIAHNAGPVATGVSREMALVDD